MKSILFFVVLFFGFLVMVKSQTPRNCSQILANNPSALSGIYTIDPDGEGSLPSMNCYCDMETDGGGWTLILNYNHLTETNPQLAVLTGSFPLQGNTELGFDESGTSAWGHTDTALTNAIPFNEVRFYGKTSEHSRIIHFKTSHQGTVSYFKTGFGSTEGISSDFTAYDDHSAYLPASINMTVHDRGNFAMTDYPLWTGSANHWLMGQFYGCDKPRWEVDDYPCDREPSTLHQIWVRQKNINNIGELKTEKSELFLSPVPANKFLQITLLKGTAVNSTVSVYNCTGQLMQTDRLSENEDQIDVSALVEGIYILIVNTDQANYAKKFIVQR